MIILGMFPKFAAIFVTIPAPVLGGMYTVIFGRLLTNTLSITMTISDLLLKLGAWIRMLCIILMFTYNNIVNLPTIA